MSEADIIRCLSAGYPQRDDVALGVGDDGAVLVPPPGRHLVSVLDTINENVHFPPGMPPAAIGHRALAVNLSDLAAMGAEPAWASLSLSLPDGEPGWVQAFADSFRQLAVTHGVTLVGGDTVRGPLSVTVQLTGFAEPGRRLARSGARPGDLVVISGLPGRAAAGLRLIQQGDTLDRGLRQAFLWPSPRVRLGRALIGIATAAIDVSDGLLTDLERMLEAGGVGAVIELDQVPVSDEAVAALGAQEAFGLALNGGDDYELCFTLPEGSSGELSGLAEHGGCPLRVIGHIQEGAGVSFRRGGEPVAAPETVSWSHFDGRQP
ncbi:MAG: thiamine-phosphate kinase [Gammaproteobacteria bacterium]